MSDRFFVETPIADSRVVLIGAEASHLVKVMRARVGETLMAFDGTGREFLCRIDEIRRNEVTCEVLESHEIDREAPREVAFLVALPKGDRQRVLVEKLTELGVAELTPIATRRSVVQPDDGTADRLRRFVIEASKQCGRNRLMRIQPPKTLAQLTTAAPASAMRLVAHPRQAESLPLAALLDSPTPIQVAIGPEGGFTDEEVQGLREHGWQILDLGPRILRVETAAAAIAALATARSAPRST